VLWVVGFLFLGYFFGGIPIVADNFPIVIMAIIILSLVPPVIEVVKGLRKKS
jgi:membrane-associated protein